MSKHLSSKGTFTGRHPFLLLLSALVAGILIQDNLPHFTVTFWLLLFATAILLAFVLQRISSVNPRIRWPGNIMLWLTFCCSGATLSCLQDLRNHSNWYGNYLKQAEALVVTVIGAPQLKEKTIYLQTEATDIKVQGKWMNITGKIPLYIYRKNNHAHYNEGQVLMIPANLTPIRNSGNPFAFDYARYAARNGMFHQAFLAPDKVKILSEPKGTRPILQRVHNALQQSITDCVKDSTTRTLIEAVMLNERAALDEELMAAYSATGIVHIIAISGMHIVLLAGLVLLVFRLLPFQKINWVRYLAAITVAWFYIALTGFAPSAVRAGVMFTLLSLGLLFNRDSNSLNLWAATGFLLLCYNPYWLYDVGVQLSFLAVLSIILFYVPIRNLFIPGNRILAWLWESIAVSIAVLILVSPLVIYYFHQFPLLGLIASIPAALYSVIIMYGSVILFLLHLIGMNGMWLGSVMAWLTKAFHYIILFLAKITPEAMRQLYIDQFEYWVWMLIITLFCLFFFKKKNSYLYSGLIAAILLIVDFIAKDITALKQEKIVVYNTARTTCVDIFLGKKVIPVNGSDTNNKKDYRYTLAPARLGFRAVSVQKEEDNDLYRIGNASILFLKEKVNFDHQYFPVDFLVVSDKCYFAPEQWYAVFHPRKIILDGSLPRWKAGKWKEKLIRLGARVHWVQEDGAWIYPSAPN